MWIDGGGGGQPWIVIVSFEDDVVDIPIQDDHDQLSG